VREHHLDRESRSSGSGPAETQVQSIQEFITHDGTEVYEFHLSSIIAVGIALGRSASGRGSASLRAATKIALFLFCFAIRHKSSQVHVLWEDHRNDIFT